MGALRRMRRDCNIEIKISLNDDLYFFGMLISYLISWKDKTIITVKRKYV